MSDLSQALSESMNVPEELVMRSARARAEASGSSVDDVLAAWSGGGAVAAAPAPVAAQAAAPAAAAEPAPTMEAAPVEAVETSGFETAVSAVAVAVPAVIEEPIVSVSIRDRMTFAIKFGAAIGFLFGVFAAVVSTRFVLTRIIPVFEDELLVARFVAEPADVALYLAVITAVFGAVLARGAAQVPAWFDRGQTIRSSLRSLTVVGAAVGAVTGLIGSGVLMGMGESIEPILETDVALVAMAPVASSVALVALMVVLGGVIAAGVQLLALPAGLTESEEEESDVIRHRLVTSYLMPVMVIVAIAAFVLPFAWLLVTFHASAPLIAMVAASGILGFAALAASRPNGTITGGEFVIAALGIGTVLLFIALVTNATSGEGGHEGEADHSEEAAVVRMVS